MRQYLKAALRRCGYLALFGPDGGRAYDAPTVGPSVTTYLRHLKATVRAIEAVSDGPAWRRRLTGPVCVCVTAVVFVIVAWSGGCTVVGLRVRHGRCWSRRSPRAERSP